MMETIDHILSKMREPSCFKGKIPVERVDADFRDFADRIEAAHKREQEDAIAATVVVAAESASEVYEPHIQSEPVGNAAKMREVLNSARRTLSKWKIDTPVSAWHEFDLAMDGIDAALSAPPRNCDLYTTDEAIRKYDWSTRFSPCGEAEWICFIDWLFAEAKGETK
jgi:hypothetical protein